MTDREPDHDGDSEGDEGDREAVERGLSQLLPEETGGYSYPHRAEGAIAQAHRHLRFVHLWLPQEGDDDPQRQPGLHTLEALAGRQELALEPRIAMGEHAARRIHDGRVHNGV